MTFVLARAGAISAIDWPASSAMLTQFKLTIADKSEEL